MTPEERAKKAVSMCRIVSLNPRYEGKILVEEDAIAFMAAAIRAAVEEEREACAVICEEQYGVWQSGFGLAREIRARSATSPTDTAG